MNERLDFWAAAAAELPWFRRWERVFEPAGRSFRWFPGAETNLAWNCLDRHVSTGRAEHTALVSVNERGDRRTITYGELLGEVERAAAALRSLGIGKGDRLTIYMPTAPEAIVLMLATVRIGAIHSVVTGLGFTAAYMIAAIYGGMEPWFGISPEGIGAVGMAINFIVTIAVSSFTREPSPEIQALVEEVRHPRIGEDIAPTPTPAPAPARGR